MRAREIDRLAAAIVERTVAKRKCPRCAMGPPSRGIVARLNRQLSESGQRIVDLESKLREARDEAPWVQDVLWAILEIARRTAQTRETAEVEIVGSHEVRVTLRDASLAADTIDRVRTAVREYTNELVDVDVVVAAADAKKPRRVRKAKP